MPGHRTLSGKFYVTDDFSNKTLKVFVGDKHVIVPKL
jgi:hypothetical protein